MIEFGRHECGYLPIAERKEWLVTNGIGGYGMGTISGILTRRYHGLLVAALAPPLGRTLLRTKFDETISYRNQVFVLFANRWANNLLAPQGYLNLERFRLLRSIPVWTYSLSDARVEKMVWMQAGANTTYIRYNLIDGSAPVSFSIKILMNYRDHHHVTKEGAWQVSYQIVPGGIQVKAFEGAAPCYLFGKTAQFIVNPVWVGGYYLGQEAYRGQREINDAHLSIGSSVFTLEPGESTTFIVSTNDLPNLDGDLAYEERSKYELGLVKKSKMMPIKNIERCAQLTAKSSPELSEEAFDQLVLAADQFIVHRSIRAEPTGYSVIAGYPWFGDRGRDTMIALPGLALVTGRSEIAATILQTYARFVNQGMIPNRFPDAGSEPEYNTNDATLWYIEALRSYTESTQDIDLLIKLFPLITEIISWHCNGTRFNIRRDPEDGLLFGGEAGFQLTWMDAKVGDWVLTPRIGKAVEINALWYNALRTTAASAARLKKDPAEYERLADQALQGFSRFWNESKGYCYDVIDGPSGSEDSLRPNQIIAVSLTYSPLDVKKQHAVVEACAQYLLTSHGLRSLSADDPDYHGYYGGDQRKRDGAYHQGTIWGWLIGPFITAYLRTGGTKECAREMLRPLLLQLADHGAGSLSEIFDGEAPFTPRGCPAQAWSVAEVLRLWQEIK